MKLNLIVEEENRRLTSTPSAKFKIDLSKNAVEKESNVSQTRKTNMVSRAKGLGRKPLYASQNSLAMSNNRNNMSSPQPSKFQIHGGSKIQEKGIASRAKHNKFLSSSHSTQI
jgi:hypothetical protein